jgi:PAS domain-containing protein
VAAVQQPVEIILARSLMANLTTPAFLVDTVGTLIFFNDAAGELLGLRFEEAGPMPAEEWGTRFEPLSEDGEPIPVEALPLSIAVQKGQPSHLCFFIRSAHGPLQEIEVSAFPIIGTAGQQGALAIFWGTEGL